MKKDIEVRMRVDMKRKDGRGNHRIHIMLDKIPIFHRNIIACRFSYETETEDVKLEDRSGPNLYIGGLEFAKEQGWNSKVINEHLAVEVPWPWGYSRVVKSARFDKKKETDWDYNLTEYYELGSEKTSTAENSVPSIYTVDLKSQGIEMRRAIQLPGEEEGRYETLFLGKRSELPDKIDLENVRSLRFVERFTGNVSLKARALDPFNTDIADEETINLEVEYIHRITTRTILLGEELPWDDNDRKARLPFRMKNGNVCSVDSWGLPIMLPEEAQVLYGKLVNKLTVLPDGPADEKSIEKFEDMTK